MNALYSDIGKVCEKYGMSSKDFFLDAAIAYWFATRMRWRTSSALTTNASSKNEKSRRGPFGPLLAEILTTVLTTNMCILFHFISLFCTLHRLEKRPNRERKNPETIEKSRFSGFGGSRWIRTTVGIASRFTGCINQLINQALRFFDSTSDTVLLN